MVRGLALISVLVTVAILGILGARALSGSGDPAVADLVSPSTAPGGTAPGATPEDPTPTTAGLPGGITAADAASCAATRATLDTAASAYAVTVGGVPPTQQALVDAGLLDAPVTTFDLSVDGEQLVLTGVGACAGQ